MDELDALLEKSTDITIKVNKKNIWHKLRLLPVQKTIELKPLPYNVFLQVSKCFAGVEELKESPSYKELCAFVEKNDGPIIKAIAYAINRSKTEPSEKLLDFIRMNIEMNDMTAITLFIITQMNMGNFTSAISLLTRKLIADSGAEPNSSGQQ